MVTVKKIYFWIGVVIGFIAPVVSGLSSYFLARTDLIDRIAHAELKGAETYAKKDDVNSSLLAINSKLMTISDDVATIKGHLLGIKPERPLK